MAFFRKKTTEKKLTTDEIVQKMEQFCAFRDRCFSEAEQKIKELGVPDRDTQDQIIGLLQETGFLDDKRFADAFARGKFRSNGWGRVRIRQELSMRKVDKKLIAEALETAIPEEEYLESLVKRLEIKLSNFDPSERDRWDKTAAAAIQKGFEPGLVFEKIGQIRLAQKNAKT